PALLIDENAMHQSDLRGRSAERQQPHLADNGEDLAEGGGWRLLRAIRVVARVSHSDASKGVGDGAWTRGLPGRPVLPRCYATRNLHLAATLCGRFHHHTATRRRGSGGARNS